MGHAHHFLSRLDRVSMPQVELALSLYRDEGLLRLLLDRARIPEGTERIALGLEAGEQSPHIIVTRAGKFVTCLGAGMSVGACPVITRGQIDAIAAKMETLRERLESAKDESKGKHVLTLLNRIYEVAEDLSKEEFLAISALQPIYAMKLLSLYFRCADELFEARGFLLSELRRTNKPKPALHELMHSYWNSLWALAHLAILSTMGGMEYLSPKVATWFNTEGNGLTLSWATTRQGFTALALRGAWAAARLGKPLLPSYKQVYQQGRTHLQNLDGAIGLAAIGSRHSRLTAETDKVLHQELVLTDPGTAEYASYVKAVRTIIRTVTEVDRKAQEKTEAFVALFGADLWVLTNKQPGPFRFASRDEVPLALATTYATYCWMSYLRRDKNLGQVLCFLFQLLPWVARQSPENLYLPREIVQAIKIPWTPDATLQVLLDTRDQMFIGRDVPEDTPARKAPCPCGSGKKYKRCCGAEKDA